MDKNDMIYLLSCETITNKGGIYAYEITENGLLKQSGYFPCDRPMYAVKCEKGLCVLLRQPFPNSDFSGYFFIDERLQNPTAIRSTQGVVACHLCVEQDAVYAVNYLSGNVVKNGERVLQRTGTSVHPTRQTAPHTHFISQTPDGYFAVCDLGTDSLAIYDKHLFPISETKAPNGYGIRHLVFSKDGAWIYAVNELVPSISVFAYKNGKAELVRTLEIPCACAQANGAAIRLSQDDTLLYASLREENCICIFRVDGKNITPLQTLDCGGDSPRDFAIFGEILVCCNERSHTATVFRVTDGIAFTPLQRLAIPAPLCAL